VKTKNFEESVLQGEGQTDYAKYMQTDKLLSLQIHPDKMVHRDELLFQIVHQSTELWLKLGYVEIEEAKCAITEDRIGDAISLIQRAITCANLLTQQLSILSHMTPWDFHEVRKALGNGSGFESPGWTRTRQAGKELGLAFDEWRLRNKVCLVDLYKHQRNTTSFNLIESLISWDESIAFWRARHYLTAVRTIGVRTVGTKGMAVNKLTALLDHQFFPSLWEVRSTLFNEDNGY
jgi:tryptophan 2,3-dioxygenase